MIPLKNSFGIATHHCFIFLFYPRLKREQLAVVTELENVNKDMPQAPKKNLPDWLKVVMPQRVYCIRNVVALHS